MVVLRNGVTIRKHGDPRQVIEAVQAMLGNEVLVGVPDANADAGRTAGEPNNAVLAFIHDQGAPEANIPQREFMRPGIAKVQEKIADKLGQGMRGALNGDITKVEQALLQVGIIAVVSIKTTIDDGIAPPLSDYTLRQRMKAGRKGGGGARKGAAQELDRRWDGQAPSTEFAKPLVDTGAMRESITFAVRSRKKRDK